MVIFSSHTGPVSRENQRIIGLGLEGVGFKHIWFGTERVYARFDAATVTEPRERLAESTVSWLADSWPTWAVEDRPDDRRTAK